MCRKRVETSIKWYKSLIFFTVKCPIISDLLLYFLILQTVNPYFRVERTNIQDGRQHESFN